MSNNNQALSKFASIVYVASQFAGNSTLASAGLKNLKAALATFVDNKQFYPLVYDAVWRGVVSSSTYIAGDPGMDFGNSYYNDHHFHYGYFVHAAAVIGYLDPDWLNQGTNKDWVNMLIRDYGNGVDNDPFFPVSPRLTFFIIA
jgi:endo-1,3(4)-beta-glucanase